MSNAYEKDPIVIRVMFAAKLAVQAGLTADAEHGLLHKGRPVPAFALPWLLRSEYGIDCTEDDGRMLLQGGRVLAREALLQQGEFEILKMERDLDKPSLVDPVRLCQIRIDDLIRKAEGRGL